MEEIGIEIDYREIIVISRRQNKARVCGEGQKDTKYGKIESVEERVNSSHSLVVEVIRIEGRI